MTNCLNCGEEITQAKGGREKKFCNPTCRYRFFLSKKAAEKSLDNISKSIPELELIKSNEKAVELWKQLKEVLGSTEHQERKMDALRGLGLIGKTDRPVLPVSDEFVAVANHNKKIDDEIAEIRAEPIPKHRDTERGRRSWEFDQQRRINNLERTRK